MGPLFRRLHSNSILALRINFCFREAEAQKRFLRFPILKRNSENLKKMASNLEDVSKIAVAKYNPGEPNFKFSFMLKMQSPVIVERQFNTERPVEEPLSALLNRIGGNVLKAVSKKSKGKKAKKAKVVEGETTTEEVENEESKYRPVILNVEDESANIKEILFGGEAISLQMKLLDFVYQIHVNPPSVELLKLSEKLMAGYLFYPKKVETVFADEKRTKFEWFLSEKVQDGRNKKPAFQPELLKFDFVSGERYFDTSKVNPVDLIDRFVKLKCTPVDENGKTGISFDAYSKEAISIGPGVCLFDSRHEFCKSRTSDPKELRVVSYNILADLYADSDFSREVLFKQCPPYALNMEYRKQLIVKELLGYNADLICLQEVDEKIFRSSLEPVLGELKAMDGTFESKGGQVSEGAACFWRRDRFNLVSSRRVILSEELQRPNAAAEDEFHARVLESLDKNEELKKSVFERTTILLETILESVQHPGKKLVVGVTHLYFKPEADHIRLLQSALCLNELVKTKKRLGEDSSDILFAGDFNSSPGNAVLEYMRKGFIPSQHEDWRSAPGREIEGLELRHRLSLDSACGTPTYTNFTLGFRDCIDYVFYETDRMAVTEVVPFPTLEELEANGAIPCVTYPSDHLALVSVLKWLN